MSLQSVLFLALPPVIGAGIGLFTNWLAIKMLFRPLRAYRFLGLRMPFTPGILPRERAGIARSLGDTVSKDLLTEDAVGARLTSASFRESLAGALAGAGSRLMSKTPESYGGAIDDKTAAVLKDAAALALRSIVASEPFRAGADAAFGIAADELGPLTLEQLVGGNPQGTPAGRMEDPEFKDAIASAASSAAFACVRVAMQNGGSLSHLVSRQAVLGLVRSAAEAAWPIATEALSSAFSDKTIRASMEKVGAKLVRKVLDRFNAFQRFFIGLGQYDRAILENMPDTINDFLEAVNTLMADDATREALVGRVVESVGELMDRPLSSWPAFGSEEDLAASKERLRVELRTALDSPKPDGSRGLLRAAASGVTVDAVLEAFPAIKAALGDSVARWFVSLVAPEAGRNQAAAALGRIASAFVGAFSASASGRPLGDLLGLDDASIGRIAAASSPGLAELAARESGAMLRSLDVRGLVVDKIDSLEMIEVERMLLRVIDRELRAVTWFGGILGFLIGAMQSVLFLFR